LEIAALERPPIEVFGDGQTSSLRLSGLGLWAGSGTYLSPIIDIGYVTSIASIDWDATLYGSSEIDFYVRYHSYLAPTLSSTGAPWTSNHLSDSSHFFWGDPGSSWTQITLGGGSLIGNEVRFVQWKALLIAGTK
jgi:hypothetical protein